MLVRATIHSVSEKNCMEYFSSREGSSMEVFELSGPDKTDCEVPDIGMGQLLYNSFSEQDPENLLLIEGDTDRRVTSQQMLQLSTSFAEGLRKLDFNPGDVIAVIGENKIDLCVAAFGIAMMGGVMCPIDSSLKSYEYQHLMSLIEPKCIIADSEVIATLQDALQKLGTSAKFVVMGEWQEDDEADIIAFKDVFSEVAVDEFVPHECEDTKNEMLCMVCSSGSTGLPKAVMLTHSGLTYQTSSMGKIILKFCPMMQTSFFYWISGILIMYAFACLGGLRVLLKTTDPVTVMEKIQNYKILSSMFSPSLLSTILLHPQIKEFDLSSLKVINCAGAPLLQSVTDKMKEELPGCFGIQIYGLSESAGTVSRAIPPVSLQTLGKPAMKTTIRIRDVETGEPLGPEEEGEIIIQSPAMMKGYYRNEEATKSAITDDGWLLSGDIGIITADGLLQLTGRKKDLLKVDAHQVSPGEIEALIGTLPGVADIVVCGIPVEENSLPMALVVREPDSDISEEDITRIVNENLSEFKRLRAGVVFVESIARTPNGKLKRSEVQPIAEALYMGAPL